MRQLLSLSLVITTLVIFSFAYAGKASAQGCVVTGNTPDGGEVVNCSGVDNDGITTTNNSDEITVEEDANITRDNGDVIRTLDGEDVVRVNGGMIEALGPSDDCVKFRLTGRKEFHMTGGTLICTDDGVIIDGSGPGKFTIEGGTIDTSGGVNPDEAIDGSDGPDEVYIMGGLLIGGDAAVDTHDGDDKIIITGGRLVTIDDSDPVVSGSRGNDHISVSNAVLDGTLSPNFGAVSGQEDDDIIKLGTGAVLIGKSDGGDGFDTLVFEMEVPEEAVNSICSQILVQDPQNGSITINNLFYEWEDFELLVCELQGVNVVRPIPTLSEWGMIAMAGLIGIVGVLFAIRKRTLVS